MMIRMAHFLKRKARLFLCGTEGASAVEFALVFPIAFCVHHRRRSSSAC